MARARDTLTHRGPDDAGSWRSSDGRVAMAMRRLAIVDLSMNGHQPMHSAADEAQATLVFNGELYNHHELRRDLGKLGHRFLGHSDTEVVLTAYLRWGTECLTRFVGMFAFAIFDPRSDEIFLARDRAGERPLFYHHASGRLSFASEIKALMENPRLARRIDTAALNYYLAYGHGPSDRSLLDGVHKLPAGHALLYHVGSDRLRIWPYWDLPSFSPRFDDSPSALCDELEALLSESVRLQLQADVPVSVMLSGGLDSSIVTALAARSTGVVSTFTVTMPTTDRSNEGPQAQRVASHFGTRHTEIVAEPASVELLPILARQFDDPIADSSMVPTFILSRLIRPHAKVALGGDGADELFGGYDRHRWAVQHDRLRVLTAGAIGPLASAALPFLPMGIPGRNYAAAISQPSERSQARVNQFFDTDWRRRLSPILRALSPRDLSFPEFHKAGLHVAGESALQTMTAADFRTYLPDDILVKVDRASMLASLEVRAPWLDHRIIEFAFSRIPDELRARSRQGKILPRLLAQRLLPPDVISRRKQGFSIPLHAWFKGEWGTFMTSVLSEAPPDFFDPRAVDALVKNQRSGLGNSHRLFALTILELWRREYGVALPSGD
jgi:asparagine synthase (glutamine-hydrolysing)